MSDLCLYELEDIVWDDFCQSDDHIVPHPSFERADDYSILGDSHKKPCHEVISIVNSTGDRSSAGYVDQGKEGVFSSVNKRRSTMLDKDSWPNTPSGVFPSSSDSNSIREASSIASENTSSSLHVIKNNKADSNNNELCANDAILGGKTSTVDDNSFSDALGDITQTDNNLDIFEDTEDKNSSDYLYYSWPEIGNFEDVDRMFRSCDSTFGLGASKEDELSWFTSADNIEATGDIVKSEFEFPCPEPNPVEYNLQNHDSSKRNSINDIAMTKDSTWASEKSDSYVSFVNGHPTDNVKDRVFPKEQIENKKQVKLHNQFNGKRKENYFGNGSFTNGSFTYKSNLPNEAIQVPLSYMHSDNSPLSGLTSVNPAPSGVKSETNNLPSSSPRDSSHTSNQLQNEPLFRVVAPVVTGKRDKLYNRQGGQSSAYGGMKNASPAVQASIVDTEGASLVIPAELGTRLMQENSTTSSGMDDISQEAASFRQLQLVMEQLDLRTKICIRDSLYRLARSAEQRHNHADLNGCCGDERDAGGAFMADVSNNFMDIETDTNPIDRSIAHLLFHRPSESSSAVRASVTSAPVMVENFETASEIKNSDH